MLLLLFKYGANRSGTAPGYFTLIGEEAPPTVRDTSEGVRTFNQRCCPDSENGAFSWCLSSSLFLSVGFSIQDEAMDVVRSAPLPGGRYLLAHLTGNKEESKGLMVLGFKLTLTRFPNNSHFTLIAYTLALYIKCVPPYHADFIHLTGNKTASEAFMIF